MTIKLADLDCEKLLAGELSEWDKIDVWRQPNKEWTKMSHPAIGHWSLSGCCRTHNSTDGLIDLEASTISIERQHRPVVRRGSSQQWGGTYREFVEKFYGRTTVKVVGRDRDKLAQLETDNGNLRKERDEACEELRTLQAAWDASKSESVSNHVEETRRLRYIVEYKDQEIKTLKQEIAAQSKSLSASGIIDLTNDHTKACDERNKAWEKVEELTGRAELAEADVYILRQEAKEWRMEARELKRKNASILSRRRLPSVAMECAKALATADSQYQYLIDNNCVEDTPKAIEDWAVKTTSIANEAVQARKFWEHQCIAGDAAQKKIEHIKEIVD